VAAAQNSLSPFSKPRSMLAELLFFLIVAMIGGPRQCKRYKAIKVQYQTLEMQTRIKTYTGWTAQIIQHEIDHCNGILI
jgi:hypothetical protein